MSGVGGGAEGHEVRGAGDVRGEAGDGGEVRGDGGGPSIRRLDTGLGLAVLRAGLSRVTLVTYTRDHVAVRTPSRPDYHDGNTLDLTAVPAPGDLDGYLARYQETVGALGVQHVRLRWEEPLVAGAPPRAPEADPGLAAAAAAHGLELSAVTVLLLGALGDRVAGEVAAFAPVPAPDDDVGGAVDRRWHASTVLYRYAAGDTPDEWRGDDGGFTAWSVEQQRELARVGRCRVWVATRHSIPVARCTLLHDRQGLAVVEDVVTHPAHRGRGIASGLVHAAVGDHLDTDPGARVGVAAAPGPAGEVLYRRLGFQPHATVWTAHRATPLARPTTRPPGA